MIFVEIKNGDIGVIHFAPFDEDNGLGKTQGELEQTGILVDSLPNPNPQVGQDSILKYDEMQGLYYEYADRPLTADENLQALQADMGTLLFESAMDKARIAELESGQAEMLMEIAVLKTGGI